MSAESPRPARPETVDQLLSQLLEAHRGRLTRIAASVCGQEFAEDAVQDGSIGFLRWYDPDEAYDGEAGALRYLVSAVVRAGLKLNRSCKRRERALPQIRSSEEWDPVDSIPASGTEPLSVVLAAEELAGAGSQLAALPVEWRTVVGARALGYTPTEIRTALGLTERQYRKRVERAGVRLRGAN